MEVQHRPGKKHGNADALSRIPVEQDECKNYKLGLKLEQLPCGGCKYCIKAHQNWGNFVETVDDVVPLVDKRNINVTHTQIT